MFALAHWLIQVLQPILVPLCFVVAWLVMTLVAWSIWSAIRDSVANAKQMHRIPCANCQFFTHDYHLKCTVHPGTALSEEAVNCMDYEPTRSV
ncbi:MAG: hypothetical protein SFY66_26255 [Oculatellaceae cyanobacterium bins.114]|nr:hypothetical protein [Oculatellaceae cyanobacterium bins.114]